MSNLARISPKRSVGRPGAAIECINTGQVFSNLSEAAAETGAHKSAICECVSGKRSHTIGLRFKRAGEPDAVEVVKPAKEQDVGPPEEAEAPKEPKPRDVNRIYFPGFPPIGTAIRTSEGVIYTYKGAAPHIREDGQPTTLLVWEYADPETGEVSSLKTTQLVKPTLLKMRAQGRNLGGKKVEIIHTETPPWLKEDGAPVGCTLQPRYLG